jgi:hypothetical protein
MQENELMSLYAKMDRPVPGQSLTNDPKNPQPFERKPEFTSIHSASEYLFGLIIDEDNYVPLMQAVAGGEPLSELAQVLLFKGFQEGKWNPDLMLLLIEPVIYMFLALAEKIDVDPVIYTDEDIDEIEDEETSGTKFEEKALEKIKGIETTTTPPPGVLTNKIKQQMDSLPEIPKESLLASPKGTEEEEEKNSLLAPPEK